MKTYYISVTEVLNRIVAVEADSPEDAIEICEDACYSGEVVLTADDFVDRVTEDDTEEIEGLVKDGMIDKNIYQIINREEE